MELDAVIARLQTLADTEDSADLVQSLPPVDAKDVEARSDASDFVVELLLLALNSPPPVTVIPRILSPNRERTTLETTCRLLCKWHAAEVLQYAVSLMFAEGSSVQKAGFAIFAEATAIADNATVRSIGFQCLQQLRITSDEGNNSEVIAASTKAICEGLKSEEEPTISTVISALFAQLLDLKSTSDHYLPLFQLFAKNEHLLQQYRETLLETATRDLVAAGSNTRSAAVIWLRRLIADSEDLWWDCFFDMYLALENYSRHLVENIWTERIQTLLSASREQWIALLLRRVRAHENPSVKKHILKLIMKTDASAQFPSLILNELIELIGDSSIFGDAPRHAGFSRFATMIPGFFRNFLSTLSPDFEKTAIQTFIANITTCVLHQSGFFNAVMTFREFQPKGGNYVNSEVVGNLKEMMKVQFTNVTPVQRKEVYEVFADMLRFRTPDCSLPAILELLSQFPLSLLPSTPLFHFSDIQTLLSSSTPEHAKGSKGTLHPRFIPLIFSLAAGWNHHDFQILVQGPTHILATIYSNAYFRPAQISACFTYLSGVEKLIITKAATETVAEYRSFLRSAAPQLLSFLILHAEGFTDPSNDLYTINQETKVTLAATVRSQQESESFSMISQLIASMGDLRSKGVYQLIGLLQFLYTVLKSCAKPLRTNEIVISHLSRLFEFREREKMEARFAQEVTVLKWKIARVGFCEEVRMVVGEQLRELLDVSSSAMKKTAFRVLKRSLRTSFLSDSTPHIAASLAHCISTGFQIVQECKLDLSVRLLQQFYKFSLSPLLFQQKPLVPALRKLINDVIALGRERWQFIRGLTLHLLSAVQRNPRLIDEFLPQVIELAVVSELRGTDLDMYFPDLYTALNLRKSQLIPSNASEAGHYSRFVTLSFLDQFPTSQWAPAIVDSVTAELSSRDSKKVDMPNSPQLKRKIAIGQLLLMLAPAISYSDDQQVVRWVQSWLKVLQTAISASVRFYLEKMVMHACAQNYAAISPILYSLLRDIDCKAQYGASALFIAGGVLMNCQSADRKTLVELISPFMVSNTAVVRRTAHFVILKYANSKGKEATFCLELHRLIEFMGQNSEFRRMQDCLQREFSDFDSIATVGFQSVLTATMNEFGSYIPSPILDRIDSITADLMSETRVDDFSLRIDEFWQLEASKYSLSPASQNYQRKVTQTAALESQHKGHHTRHPLILLACFITSPLTLAGLTRSCEVFAARKLLYSDEKLLQTLEFKQMSVTAEKWMPMARVDRSAVKAYLQQRKASGYSVYVVESCGQSRSIAVNQMAVLVPLEAGDSLPAELEELVDGRVRLPLLQSAGVSAHIAASLCVWDYTKQHFL